jgi:cytoskeletal protein RodZ
VEGGIGLSSPSVARSSSSLRSSTPLGGSAVALVEDLPPTPMNRSRWVYALIAPVVLGVVGFSGVRIAAHAREIRAAERQVPPPAVLVAPPSDLSIPLPSAAPASLSTTAPLAASPAPSSSQAPSAASAEVSGHPTAERHTAFRSAAASRRAPRAEEDPFASESTRPAEPAVTSSPLESLLPSHPSPAPSATSAPSNPDELFDERK